MRPTFPPTVPPILATLLMAALAGCVAEDETPKPEVTVTQPPPHPAGPAEAIPSDLPTRVPGAIPIMGGYRSADDLCRRVGEDGYTNQFLDDAADLVGCPEGMAGMEAFVAETGARLVGRASGYVLFSVPRR